MNWANELCDLYDKNLDKVGVINYKEKKSKDGVEKIPIVLLPIFHTTVTAQITVDIDETGNLLGAERVADKDKMTIIPVTAASGCRTSGKEAHPLCDNLKYLTGEYEEYVGKDCSENHKLYMEGLEAWHLSQYTHEKVDAIYQYLKKECLIEDLIKMKVLIIGPDGRLDAKEKIQAVKQSDSFVRFRIIGEQDLNQNRLIDTYGALQPECWLDRTLQQSYIAYCKSTLSDIEMDYLTGDMVPVTYYQPKKVRNEADGAKLISSNDSENFTFRGRFATKEEAFAIGYENSQKATNALKWIIRLQGYSWDGLSVVIWESDLNKIPDWSGSTDSITDNYDLNVGAFSSTSGWGDDEEEENKYQGTGKAAAIKFRAAMQGYGANLKTDSNIQLLAFDSATTGRLAMTECKRFESSRYLNNIRYWHESCMWLHSRKRDGKNYTYFGVPGVREIADALYGTDSDNFLTISGQTKLYAEVCKRLLTCISERTRVPQDMINRLVSRASSPVSFKSRYNWERVLYTACSFVKKQRFERNKEVWDLEVNKTTPERDYLYGRLLAVADRIEYRTYDKDDGKRVTNARRYMSAFSQHPYQTWKELEERIQPYLQKLSVPERNVYNRVLDEIYHQFKDGDFSNNARLEGLYLLGYHSQSYAFRYDKNKEEKPEEENNND